MSNASGVTATTTNTGDEARSHNRSRGHGRGRGHGYRRGRGRGRGGAVGRPEEAVMSSIEGNTQAEHTGQNSTQLQLQSQLQPQPQLQSQQSQTTRPRGRTRGQGSRGNNGAGTRRRTNPNRPTETQPASRPRAQVGGRTFGGRLTRDDNEAAEHFEDGQKNSLESEHLRADAPEFKPGEQVSTADVVTSPAPKASRARGQKHGVPKVTTKSTAHDIATRIHEDIANNLYECPICTNELSSKSRVWSCHRCWTVFHLSCVKKWSKNEGSAFRNQEQAQGDSDIHRQWRCPGCNLPQDTFPTSYSCWCEKEIDPRPLPGLPPHSCGQTCSRNRQGCPHPCDSTCHAGPCPPCTAMGPVQDCFCGKNSSTKKCTETNYVSGWSCGEVCGDLLPCGKHTCPRPCHEGLCGACEERVDARCYCGKVEAQILCSVTEEEITSQRFDSTRSETGSTPDTWVGSFKCRETCNRTFDCGIHFCQKDCHPQDANQPHCPQSPDVVLRCPCGKTPLSKIQGYKPRTSCADPIPNCSEPCGKALPCGHPCPMVCHTGPCRPCFLKTSISCRCGRGTFSTICHQGKQDPPQCFRVCKATMNCGRHTCMEHCCPGERLAIERQASKRKLRPLSAAQGRSTDNDVEAEHICTRVCGRMLKCGRHTCPELCHKGACNTCREAIFDEIPCHCGRSVLYPPQPCGTRPPSCRFDCDRPKPCRHPQTPHNCHTDDEECPRCPFLTEKFCLCGKKLLKNQPCWLTDGRCGMVCGEPLKCGSHTCQKECHRPGDCEDASGPCKQLCGKTKKLCGHPCSELCHAPFACSEKAPCPTMVMITCPCGRLRKEKRCNASRAASNKDATLQQESPSPVASLKCDDECARLERNRNLASALKVDIDPTTTLNQHPSAVQTANGTVAQLPYSEETLDIYIQLSSTAPLSTLQDYETTLHNLATSNTQRSVRFQPAKAPLRAFVHSLASDWGFASESFDPEPHRHVFVLKPTQWTSPGTGLGSGIGIRGVTVGECVRIRERELYKEREARRIAAAEARALREASKAFAVADGDGSGGWAQVASRKKQQLDGTGSSTNTPLVNVTRTSTPTLAQMRTNGGSIYAALSMDSSAPQRKKDGVLVLRSGVGTSKAKKKGPAPEDLADSWEDEVEKEEQEEQEERQSRSSQEMDRTSTAAADVADSIQ